MRFVVGLMVAVGFGSGVFASEPPGSLSNWKRLAGDAQVALVKRTFPARTEPQAYKIWACVNHMAKHSPDPWNVDLSDALALCKVKGR